MYFVEETFMNIFFRLMSTIFFHKSCRDERILFWINKVIELALID